MPSYLRSAIAALLHKRGLPAWGFAALLSASIVAGSHVVFSGVIDAGLDRNYMTSMGATDLVLIVLATPILAVLVALLALAIERAGTSAGRAHGTGRPVVAWLVIAGILLAAWTPYLLTYAPGSVMPDSLYSIAGDRTNHHPILFTAIVHSFARLGAGAGDVNRGVFAYTVVQSLVLALALAAGIVWARRRGAPGLWTAATVAYFALVPVFPIYALNVQKDPLFSLFVALLAVVAFRIADTGGALLRSGRGVAAFLTACALVLFFRNNGVLVVFGTVLAVAFVYRRGYLRFYGAVIALLIVTFLIQGPGYDALQIRRNTFVESIGIMLQQVGYVAASDGAVTPSQQEFLGGMLPYDEWQSAYAPCLVDTLKWNPAFDGGYLNANRPEFLRTWTELLRQNPGSYLRAYALATLGFWNAGVNNQYGFADTKIVPNQLGVAPTDLLEKVTGTSLKPLLDATRGKDGTGGYVGAGVLIWVTLLAGALLFLRRHGRYALALAPLVSLWASVMVATPVAFSLRYVFAIALCLPGILLLPFVGPAEEA